MNETPMKTPIREFPALALNLDAMSSEELAAFVETFREADLNTRSRELFPQHGIGYCSETQTLLDYACYKIKAIRARLEGDIQNAQELESTCDEIYSLLPRWAKGW